MEINAYSGFLLIYDHLNFVNLKVKSKRREREDEGERLLIFNFMTVGSLASNATVLSSHGALELHYFDPYSRQGVLFNARIAGGHLALANHSYKLSLVGTCSFSHSKYQHDTIPGMPGVPKSGTADCQYLAS